MALRTPLYLDADTLFGHAAYNGVEVPQREEIVATMSRHPHEISQAIDALQESQTGINAGQRYDQVPTGWKVEEPVYFGPRRARPASFSAATAARSATSLSPRGR
jgi:hypothetical protein